MRTFHIILIATFGLLIGYVKTHKEELALAQLKNKIQLIDDFQQERKFKTAEFREEGEYRILYIGKPQSIIPIDYNYTSESHFNYDRYPFLESKSKPAQKILLQVDTTQYIASPSYFFDFASAKFYHAHPVMIYNQSQDTLTVGWGDYFSLILEAQTPDSEWEAIETWFIYSCGTGLNSIILPAKEMALTSVPIFQGPFKTQARLKMGNAFSNTFEINIHQGQFEKRRYDERF